MTALFHLILHGHLPPMGAFVHQHMLKIGLVATDSATISFYHWMRVLIALMCALLAGGRVLLCVLSLLDSLASRIASNQYSCL